MRKESRAESDWIYRIPYYLAKPGNVQLKENMLRLKRRGPMGRRKIKWVAMSSGRKGLKTSPNPGNPAWMYSGCILRMTQGQMY